MEIKEMIDFLEENEINYCNEGCMLLIHLTKMTRLLTYSHKNSLSFATFELWNEEGTMVHKIGDLQEMTRHILARKNIKPYKFFEEILYILFRHSVDAGFYNKEEVDRIINSFKKHKIVILEDIKLNNSILRDFVNVSEIGLSVDEIAKLPKTLNSIKSK